MGDKMTVRHMLGLVKYHTLGLVKGFGHYAALHKKNRYILVSTGIGDVVWFGAYYRAFKEQYEIQNMKLLILEKYKEILLMLGLEENELIIINRKDIERYSYFALAKGFRKIVSGQIGDYEMIVNRPIRTFISSDKDYTNLANVQIERLGIEMDVLYKYGYFNLRATAKAYELKYTKAVMDNANELVNRLHMNEKTVVLVPYANTRRNIPISFWTILVQGLKDRGYQVFTNCKDNDEKPIEGSLVLVASLDCMTVISKVIGYTISARCGLADLIYYAGCNIAVIHYKAENNPDDYQCIAANVESFEGIHQRCFPKRKQNVLDIRIADIDINEDNVESIIEQITENRT